MPLGSEFITGERELKKLIGDVAQNTINDLSIDVLVDCTPGETWDVSSHGDVEYSAEDNRVKKPTSLKLECIFTDSPPDVKRPVTWREKKDILEGYKESQEVLEINTEYDTYPNMQIVSFTPRRTRSTETALFVTIEFRAVNIIYSETVEVDEKMIPRRKRRKKKNIHANTAKATASTASMGTQQATAATEGSTVWKFFEGMFS